MQTLQADRVLSWLAPLLLGLSGVSGAQQPPECWTPKEPMPTPRFACSAAAVNGRIYVLGGHRFMETGTLPVSQVEEYDPATDTWTEKEPLPTARRFLSTAVVDGTIYAIGGGAGGLKQGPPPVSTVEAYDPAMDHWIEELEAMPTPRYDAATGVVEGKIYVIGGVEAGQLMSSVVEVYDVAKDAWTAKSPMPTRRGAACAAVVDGNIYVIGGISGGPHDPALRTVEMYDPSSDGWISKAPLPTGRMWCSAIAVNGQIRVFGGFVLGLANDTVTAAVEAYDPRADQWIDNCAMPSVRTNLATSAVNGRIYAIGGALALVDTGEALSRVDQFDTRSGNVFLRGDCNGDGEVNISDATCALDRLFAGATPPGCLAAVNTNGDDDVNIADPVFLLNFLFGGGPRISAPFPDCGPGTLPADEELGCLENPGCK